MSNVEQLLTYIRLLKFGEITCSKTIESHIERCSKLRWAVPSGRKNHYLLTDLGRENIPEYLVNQWTEWEVYCEKLNLADCELSVDGVRAFERLEKITGVELPLRIHHKTLACCGGRHSKSGISKSLEKIAASSVVTTDQILRISANTGLKIKISPYTEISCDQIMAVLGEVAIPERAFLDGITITGEMPKAIFTIENRGAYVDFPRINTDILLIHAPGDDTALAIKLLNLLPANLPCYHFGDIDPKGLKIANSLRRKVPQKMQLFLPGFWADYVNETFTGRKHWPENDIVDLSSDIIRTLRKEKKWLEQERIILDPRLQVEIRKLITTTP
ncbi:MAG: Wadjet anti-phage system protein JetD domain-containing protein [Geobacteraceae bacterium]